MRALHSPAVAPIEMTNGNFRRLEVCQNCGNGNSTEEILTETAIESALISLCPEQNLYSSNQHLSRSQGSSIHEKDWDLHPDAVVICTACDSLNSSNVRYYDNCDDVIMRNENVEVGSHDTVMGNQEEYEFIDVGERSGVIIEEIEDEEDSQVNRIVHNNEWDDVPVKGMLMESNSESFEMVVVQRSQEVISAERVEAVETLQDTSIPCESVVISEVSGIETLAITEVPIVCQQFPVFPQNQAANIQEPAQAMNSLSPPSTENPRSIWSLRKLDSETVPKVLTPEDYRKEQQDARRESYVTPLEDLYKKYNHQPILQNGIIRVIHTPPPPRRFSTFGHLRRTSSCGTIETYGDALKRRPFWYIEENSSMTTVDEVEVGAPNVIEIEETVSTNRSGCFPMLWNFFTCKWADKGVELAEANDTVTEVKKAVSSASNRGRLARRMTIEEEHAGDYFK
ncbi:hypothetical protein CRE_20766 [Caenorhabditis remanei]|uniref:Uncharacterized protein n=2 Tax=Caenorhabditis remanei TaxID=31234 RepID=E3MFG2_CAERE|nr:hypothetical protein CRE_20766 [Caenorhabditis remanei]